MNPQTIVLFVILLGVLITVHELGHFLIAKALNVKVLRFSIGFGPKIVGFTRGETEYRIAWIPLGGYVKMAGELPHDEESPQDAKRGFLAQPPWKRALIVIGGPAFNLIFPLFIYFFVFFGAHEQLAPVVRHVQPGLPAAEAGIQPGDRILAVDGEPVASFERFAQAIARRADVQTRILLERDGQRLEKVLVPAGAFTSDVFSETRGEIGVGPVSPEPVLGVPEDSPAHTAGLRTFDRVVQVNGQPVADLNALGRLLESAEGTARVTVARLLPLELPGIGGARPTLVEVEVPLQEGEGLAALGAEPSELYVARVYAGGPAHKAGVRRGDRMISVDGRVLRSFSDFQIAIARARETPFELVWRRGGELQKQTLSRGRFDTTDLLGQKVPMEGVGVAAGGWAAAYGPEVDRVNVHIGMGEAVKRGAEMVPFVISRTVMVIGRLFTGDMPLGTVGGPIMMFQLTGKTAESGYRDFLSLMGAISINLGIMNLLPIPILDGFALLSALWEAVRRRPIPVRAREIANMVGLAMLLIIMVLVFKNDLTR
jgi:regulator of sigma E protease